ncbi:MAG TPA: ribosome-associated translation inhibitor RaiA [Alphaproteobacteria bacterium]|nr:ribosome-associated translation inhibitor RaiA [Alphaproteobacteria bacterium]
MKVSVSGKQLDVGEALRTHIEHTLLAVVDKYFGKALDAHAVLSRQAHLYRADVAVHAGRNIVVQGHAEADAPYPAFDAAAEHIGKRLRRYKRRLRDHHKQQSQHAASLEALQYVLAAPTEHSEDAAAAGDKPVIVAELKTAIDSMTVGEAVMRLDLAELPAMLFRNSAHGELNMIYRRPDGNIGWVDPRGGTA